MGKKTGARDVAAAAGVSPATVDRVLNGRGGVSLEKQKRVLDWAGKLGLDRNLRRRPSRIARIGVIMPEPSNPFYDSLRIGFAKANKVFFGVNVQNAIHYADLFANQAKADLIRSLSRTHDALVVVTPEHPLVADALHAVTPDTPVVTLASDLPNSGRLTYVGPDNRLAGRVVADLMGRLLGDRRGEVLVISGLHSLVCHGEREMGFRSALQERHPDCRIVGVVESRERRDMTGELIRDVLECHPSLGGIYNVSSGNRALGDTLKRLGRDQDVILVTHELTAERRALLREGVIDAIIDQNPEMEALVAIETLAHHLGRVEITSASPSTPFTIHFRENC